MILYNVTVNIDKEVEEKVINEYLKPFNFEIDD